MIGCLPSQALAFLAVFVYATHATQAIAFEWKPGFTLVSVDSKCIYSRWLESREYSVHTRLCNSVCLSVCLHDKTKTAETKITKVGKAIVHRDISPINEY